MSNPKAKKQKQAAADKKRIKKLGGIAKISYSDHLKLQTEFRFDALDEATKQFTFNFFKWHDETYPDFAFYEQYQPQCILTLLNKNIPYSYNEYGCGAGKTIMMMFAIIINAYIRGESAMMVAPRLQLLRQSLRSYFKCQEIFNEYLTSIGQKKFFILPVNVSSDPFDIKSEQDKLENAAATEIEQDMAVVTLRNPEEIAKHLGNGTRSLFLVCDKSLHKVEDALTQSDTKLYMFFDEFHTLQTADAVNAQAFLERLNSLKEHATGIHAMSATPRTSLESSMTTNTLSIESGNWGVNGVYQAIGEYSVDAKKLRTYGILKQELKFHWNLKIKGIQIPQEIKDHIKAKQGIEEAEKAVDSISQIPAFARYMSRNAVGLMFLPSVPYIELFMSEDLRAWREQLEEKLGCMFYASHAGIPSIEREQDLERLEEQRKIDGKKHIILNHSTWLMGMDYRPISWVYFGRHMESHNLVQAASRGTRKFVGINTCNFVFAQNFDENDPSYNESISMIKTMYDAFGTDIKHYMIQEEERTKASKTIEDDPSDYDVVLEMTFEGAVSEVVEMDDSKILANLKVEANKRSILQEVEIILQTQGRSAASAFARKHNLH